MNQGVCYFFYRQQEKRQAIPYTPKAKAITAPIEFDRKNNP
jgi:hypothetical protein